MPTRLSADQARRIALAAQGLGRPRPKGPPTRRHGRSLFARLAVVQIDSVNVVCRSQELPLFARLGHHPRDLIPRLTAAGTIFEYWGHEASHLDVRLHPLLRWRMHDAQDGIGVWGNVARVAHEQPALVERIFHQIASDGPITTRDVAAPGERGSSMWGWTPAKRALEYLFWSGRITARRGPSFERRYDLPERMLPTDVLDQPTPTREAAQRELLMIAAAAYGVATVADLADYFRLHVPTCRRLVDELVGEGRLQRLTVDGWSEAAFAPPELTVPHNRPMRALLSPFDSLIWNRARTERLFGFRYRIEIYVPKPRRVHGYYVLPFLLDGQLVARVDLKADRATGRLLVQSAHGEPDADQERVAGELLNELGELARFLTLDQVQVMGAGDLAPALAAALRAAGG